MAKKKIIGYNNGKPMYIRADHPALQGDDRKLSTVDRIDRRKRKIRKRGGMSDAPKTKPKK